MLVAVISDTHGITPAMKWVKNEIKDADALIHLGDNIVDLNFIKEGFGGEVYGVRGNCDFTSEVPVEQTIELGGKRFFITHGHNYGVKYGLSQIFFRGKELEVDAVLFGHSHCKINTEEEGILLINPGSPSLPKDGSASIAFIKIVDDIIDVYIKKR